MGEDKKSCSPENMKGVANELRKLADQIESGKITVGGVVLSICNAVSLKVKQKLVSGQVKYDVSLAASLVDDETSSQSLEPEYQKKKKDKPVKEKKKSRPYEAKKLKKTLAQLWKQISNAIAAQKKPDSSVLMQFYDICKEYGQRADLEWHSLWTESVESVKQMVALAEKGDFQGAGQLLSTINNQKKSCHKKYK